MNIFFQLPPKHQPNLSLMNVSDNLSHVMALFDHREITSIGLAGRSSPPPSWQKLCSETRSSLPPQTRREKGKGLYICQHIILIVQIGGRYLVILCNKIPGLDIGALISWDFGIRDAWTTRMHAERINEFRWKLLLAWGLLLLCVFSDRKSSGRGNLPRVLTFFLNLVQNSVPQSK